MLDHSFPELKYEEGKKIVFVKKSQFIYSLPVLGASNRIQQMGYWDDIENRRRYLLDLAKTQGFDPEVLSNWQGSSHKIRANQVINYLSN